MVIIANEASWHLLGEVVFPREHIESFYTTQFESIILLTLERWATHLSFLNEVAPTAEIQRAVYHGLTVNERLGQSIPHFHTHVYSTMHPLVPLPRTGRKLGVCQVRGPAHTYDLHLIEDDTPPIVLSYDTQLKRLSVPHRSKAVASILTEMIDMGRAIAVNLYSDAPASIGLFWLPARTIRCWFFLAPVRRWGTLQEFQGQRFTKFDRDAIFEELMRVVHKVTS